MARRSPRLAPLLVLLLGLPGLAVDYPVTIQRGNGLANVFARLNAGETARVAYLGGSVTQMTGWRDNVTAWFQSRYPGRMTEVNAGWGGTGSLIGAMRFQRDVLARRPDLVFIEFAVNDLPEDPLAFVQRNCEGFPRQAWAQDPAIDLCFVETIAWYSEAAYLAGAYPTPVQAHYLVADHYGLPSVNVGWALYRRVMAGTPWTDLAADRVHPTAAGSQVYSDAVIAYLETERVRSGSPADHPLPPPTTDFPVMAGEIRELASLSPPPAGWTLHMNEYGVAAFLQSSAPGATITLPFTGPAAACKVIMSPEGGGLSYSADSAAFVPANVPAAGPAPWAFPVAKTLSNSQHTLTLRVDSGTARIINLEAARTAEIARSARGDFDRDDDVDQADFGHLQACYSGPGIAQGDAACQDTRLDGDGDVDDGDFNLWQACYSGPGERPPASCF